MNIHKKVVIAKIGVGEMIAFTHDKNIILVSESSYATRHGDFYVYSTAIVKGSPFRRLSEFSESYVIGRDDAYHAQGHCLRLKEPITVLVQKEARGRHVPFQPSYLYRVGAEIVKMAEIKWVHSQERSAAKTIFRLINGEAKKGNMLPWSFSEIQKRISEKKLLGLFSDSKLVGVVGFHAWDSDLMEICSLVIDKNHRRKGFGTALIKTISSFLASSGAQVFALANENSEKAFSKAGFAATGKSNISSAVWEWCESCSHVSLFPDCKCQPMLFK